MNSQKILTYRQYADMRLRKTAAKHGITLTAAKREVPEQLLKSAWRSHVLDEFSNGAEITTPIWQSLDEGLQYRILRSRRALRDEKLTHWLRSKSVYYGGTP